MWFVKSFWQQKEIFGDKYFSGKSFLLWIFPQKLHWSTPAHVKIFNYLKDVGIDSRYFKTLSKYTWTSLKFSPIENDLYFTLPFVNVSTTLSQELYY